MSTFITSSLVPESGMSFDLGDPGSPWVNIYVDNVITTVISGGSVTTSVLNLVDNAVINIPTGVHIQGSGYVDFINSNDILFNNVGDIKIGNSNQSIIPSLSGTVSVGTSTEPFSSMYATTIYEDNQQVVNSGVGINNIVVNKLSGTLQVSGSLTPTYTSVYSNLISGTTISGNTIYQNSVQVIDSGTGINNITVTKSNNLLTVSGSLTPTFTSVNANVISGTTISGNSLWLSGTQFIPNAYAKLDGSNQPFTGNLNVSGSNSNEYRITDGNYTRLVRTSGNDLAQLLNQVTVNSLAEATGGTVTHSGGYTYHTFLSGNSNTLALTNNLNIDYLVVGGGGGGGASRAGGGGAGGFLSGTTTLNTGSYTIVIGSGGTGSIYNGSFTGPFNGGISTFNGLTAFGGGGGGNDSGVGASGASGGGTGGTGGAGGIGVVGQGNNGGAGGSAPIYPAGGGGGASSAGGAGTGSVAGNGGNGKTWLNGVTYAGGGGGSYYGFGGAGTLGTGGTGGGGNGGNNVNVSGQNATANTGGGGGGSNNIGTSPMFGGNGAAGIVIVRYVTPGMTINEINIISSSGSTLAGEGGINTFSDSTSSTHIAGNRINFDISGSNRAFINSSGNFVCASGIVINSPNNAQWLLTVSNSGTAVFTSGIWV